jgi:Zn-dependent protease with chaperone function
VTLAAPTILALETDSAWIVILAVSMVTLPAALLLRKLIGRPGGMHSGILLGLPLLLPLVAAIAYHRAVLPEFAVLQPAKHAIAQGAGDLLHLLYLSDGQGSGTFYALIGSVGPWILLVGVSVSSFMLIRRALGTYLLHRLIQRCSPPSGAQKTRLLQTVADLAGECGLRHAPEVLILPPRVSGAFVVGTRKARILVSEDLIEILDEEELTAILAHEIAHVAARDVPVVFTAGLMRDMVAWNPLAHLAYRKLTHDRELEADKRAASITSNPLSVASGLLKMYELIKKRRPCASRAALAFLRPGGRIARRVSHLLDVADGQVVEGNSGRLPYLMAAVLVAALGLQVGARIAADRAALAIVWGTPEASQGIYSPGTLVKRPHKGEKGAQIERGAEASLGRLRNFSSIEEQNIDEWVKDMTRWARRQGVAPLSPLMLRWEARQEWKAVPLRCAVSSICIYRMEGMDGSLLP